MIENDNRGYDRDVEINQILTDLKSSSKKQALSEIAKYAGENLQRPSQEMLEDLLLQEEQENSAIGFGVAIPVIKKKNLQKPYTILAKLPRPVDYDAFDGIPVDLVCVVFSPEQEGPLYLRRLSRLTRMFLDADLCKRLREVSDVQAIRSLLHNPDGWMMAA